MTESPYARHNSYGTAGVLGWVTMGLALGGWVGLWIAALGFRVAADFFGLAPTPQREATLQSVLAIGLYPVIPLSSIVAGRWAAQRNVAVTPWLLVTNAAVVVLVSGWGGGFSGPGSFAFRMGRKLLGSCLWVVVAVLGWKVGAWTVTARQPQRVPTVTDAPN